MLFLTPNQQCQSTDGISVETCSVQMKISLSTSKQTVTICKIMITVPGNIENTLYVDFLTSSKWKDVTVRNEGNMLILRPLGPQMMSITHRVFISCWPETQGRSRQSGRSGHGLTTFSATKFFYYSLPFKVTAQPPLWQHIGTTWPDHFSKAD